MITWIVYFPVFVQLRSALLTTDETSLSLAYCLGQTRSILCLSWDMSLSEESLRVVLRLKPKLDDSLDTNNEFLNAIAIDTESNKLNLSRNRKGNSEFSFYGNWTSLPVVAQWDMEESLNAHSLCFQE